MRLYAQPGVEAACLALQDEADADVSLVLFALWLGRTGRVVAPQALERARAVAEAWQRQVTGPVRRARRALKEGSGELGPELAPPLAAARQRLLAVELDLERALLTALERLAAPCAAGSADPGIAAEALRLMVPLPAAHARPLALLLRAGFPDRDREGLLGLALAATRGGAAAG